jgi:glycosyltransferase involved in cell wall biosynthesis
MRILFLSNFFPPARSGGYTQWCYEVTERLAARGHVIGVLTSNYELAKVPASEPNTHRLLHLDGDLNYYQPLQFFATRQRQHRENLAYLEKVVKAFAPDLMFVWGMWALSRALPALAEQLLPGRVVYYLSDYWPSATDMHTAYWRVPARRWYMRLTKRVLSRIALSMLAAEGCPVLRFEHAICVSAKLRELLIAAGLPLEHARVIHGGTDVDRFPVVRERAYRSGPLKLLYAGQLVQHKGVHTAIQAMAKLVHERGMHQIDLTLFGSGHPAYEAYLHDLVEKEDLQRYVSFRQPIPRDRLPAVMQAYDVLVFPSIYEEPLARITQEAMAAGLVVVGTTTGGSKEILRSGETGLAFSPEDAQALAEQVARLNSDPHLYRRLAKRGHQTVHENFTLDRMVTEIDTYLQDCFAGSSLRA